MHEAATWVGCTNIAVEAVAPASSAAAITAAVATR